MYLPNNVHAYFNDEVDHVLFAKLYRLIAIYNNNWDVALNAISRGLHIAKNKEIKAELFILLSEGFYHKAFYTEAIKAAKAGLALTCDKQKRAALCLAMAMPLLKRSFFKSAESLAKEGLSCIKDIYNPQIASELYAALAWSKYQQSRYKEACDIAIRALNTYSSSIFNHTIANLYMVEICANEKLGRIDTTKMIASAGLRLNVPLYFRKFFLMTLNKHRQ